MTVDANTEMNKVTSFLEGLKFIEAQVLKGVSTHIANEA